MQIVIEITDRMYEDIKQDHVPIDIGRFIRNGTPLPKGHGRLIDADALDLEREVDMADDWKTAHEIANCVKYAPTILEADKAESEG